MPASNGARRKRPRPPLLRTRKIPPDAASQADLVCVYTRTIQATRAHLACGSGWVDRPTLFRLQCAVDARGEILERLRASAPKLRRALIHELHLDEEVNP